MTESKKEIFETNLKKAFKASEEIDFTRFILDRYFRDHLKGIQMAGDLGSAYSEIGNLQRFISQFTKDGQS